MPRPRPDRNVAWFNCSLAGIAGDMALGSLVDAGADSTELFRLLERLPIGGWSLDFETCLRNGLSATRAIVSAQDTAVIRTFMHVVAIIEEARLPPRVRDRAISAFRVLAEVEGQLHQRPTDHVHFHEVGGHDAIVDIVGTAAALELLGVDTVTASAVATGHGVVRTAHGLLPVPSPAVSRLLADIPVVGRDIQAELTTPTGASMLRAWASSFGGMPGMTVRGSGFGAGAKQLEGIPNCTQVVLGELTGLRHTAPSGRPLVQLEANVDDATGETLASAVSALMDAGALDAWIVPILMKKGRPAHTVAVLCDPSDVANLTRLLHETTGTLGVRMLQVSRWAAERELDEVLVEGHVVRLKISRGRVKAEHADVERVASLTGLSILEVAARAEAEWRASADSGSVLDAAPEHPAGQGLVSLAPIATISPGRLPEGPPDDGLNPEPPVA